MMFDVTDIEWDVEDAEVDLPDAMLVVLETERDIEMGKSLTNDNMHDDIVEEIINSLTDEFGWCILNCTIKRVPDIEQ